MSHILNGSERGGDRYSETLYFTTYRGGWVEEAAGETEAELRALHSALWKVQRMNF